MIRLNYKSKHFERRKIKTAKDSTENGRGTSQLFHQSFWVNPIIAVSGNVAMDGGERKTTQKSNTENSLERTGEKIVHSHLRFTLLINYLLQSGTFAVDPQKHSSEPQTKIGTKITKHSGAN